MNAWAPAFQAVQLAPSEGDDGRLRAADLLALDLNGLELVTLSACESALVRFDHADNPRGLAPTLLLRGADAVVGTLWPVKARVAETFFPALYGELSRNTGLLDAYALAMQRTRRTHSELRDWGAFYFMGDWRGTPREDAT
jgi:CHAT domain-containing protein